MAGIPVMLNLKGHRCVIVGGGATAARRAATLVEAGAQVQVIAPQIAASIEALPITIHHRPYHTGDVAGARLVVIATDDAAINEAVHREATEAGALVNRADVGDDGDLTFMARALVGSVTVAVDSGCGLPVAASAIRDELAATLDPGWAAMLAIAAPYRQHLVEQVRDIHQRRRLIEKLTSAEGVRIYKSHGKDAYSRYCVGLALGGAQNAVACAPESNRTP